MAVTTEQFATGMTMDEYQAQMSQNKDEFAANIDAAPVTAADVDRFTALSEPLNVLVVTEDWCGDSLAHLPVLFRLAREAGDRLNVRVFKRDENKELAAQFPMPTGRVAIPIIAFFDQSMHETGKLLERPQVAHEEMAAFMADFFVRHPDLGTAGQPISALTPEARQALFIELGPWRKGRVDAWNHAAVAEFTAAAAVPAGV